MGNCMAYEFVSTLQHEQLVRLTDKQECREITRELASSILPNIEGADPSSAAYYTKLFHVYASIRITKEHLKQQLSGNTPIIDLMDREEVIPAIDSLYNDSDYDYTQNLFRTPSAESQSIHQTDVAEVCRGLGCFNEKKRLDQIFISDFNFDRDTHTPTQSKRLRFKIGGGGKNTSSNLLLLYGQILRQILQNFYRTLLRLEELYRILVNEDEQCFQPEITNTKLQTIVVQTRRVISEVFIRDAEYQEQLLFVHEAIVNQRLLLLIPRQKQTLLQKKAELMSYINS